jgi:hypothetical protein
MSHSGKLVALLFLHHQVLFQLDVINHSKAEEKNEKDYVIQINRSGARHGRNHDRVQLSNHHGRSRSKPPDDT